MDKIIAQVATRLKGLTRDQLVAISIVISLTMIGLTYFWITGREEDKELVLEPGSVDQPIPFVTDKVVSLNLRDEEIEIETDWDNLPIYDFTEESHVQEVEAFITDIGKGFSDRENIDQVVYYWRDEADDPFYLTEYNAVLDRVFFRYDEPLSGSKFNPGSFDEDNAEQFFNDFTATYWGEGYEYGNIKVTTEFKNFRIEANRLIDDVPVELADIGSFSDYLIVREDGRILEGSFYLFEIDESTRSSVDLVELGFLNNAISRNDYPKHFIEGSPIGLDLAELGVDEYELDPDSPFLGDAPVAPALDDIPEVERCNTTSISIVYLFVNIDADKLTPVYRVDCIGSIRIGTESYDVPVVVYASAIDPEYVYVPGTLAE